MNHQRLLNYFNRIRFEGPNDKGAGAPGGDPTPGSAEPAPSKGKWFSPVDSSGQPLMDGRVDGEPLPADPNATPKVPDNESDAARQRIKDTAKEIDKASPNKDKTLPYFDDESDPAEPQKPATADPADPAKPAEPTATDKFYDPAEHAKDKPVYPNAYNTRQDGEYAAAEKINLFKQKAEKLQELKSEVGATVPFEIQQKIEQYSDVTKIADASDDEVREFIVNLDMSLKGVEEKLKNVSTTFNKNQNLDKATKKYNEALNRATEASKVVNLEAIINKVGADGNVEDVISEVDVFITNEIKPLQHKINLHESDEKFIEDKGHAEYLKTLRALESDLAKKKSELQGHKQSIVDWHDAKVGVESAKKSSEQAKPLSKVERLKQADNTYDAWKGDRSVGPFALDIFKAPTAAVEAHFRSYAYAEKNINEFDLTTKSGWDSMVAKYKAEMDTRWKDTQASTVQAQEKKRTSKATTPVPQPTNNTVGRTAQHPHNAMEESRKRIREHSKNLYS